VNVEAGGINFPDLAITQGRYQLKPPLPFVPGCEIAGRIASAPQASGFARGAFAWTGGYAEQAAVPVAHLVRMASDTPAPLAALVVNYHTVYYGLRRRWRLRAGETLPVLGAGGGIGTAACSAGDWVHASSPGCAGPPRRRRPARCRHSLSTRRHPR
jgi:NADPH:quinone reductase